MMDDGRSGLQPSGSREPSQQAVSAANAASIPNAGAPTRTIELNDLTPEELAQIFAPMLSDEQARFFNALDILTRDWRGSGWCMQCAYIVDDLDDGGVRVIETLAGHVAASGTDARSGQTACGLDPKGDGPTGEAGDAQ